ncbi:terminase [Bacillus siamensis]|uniref:terminase n=1 Tax=Bacillus siamensis TaxID=659243 RepID=UPI0006463FE5|nr:terminase [Bacillus siamensis]
MAYEEKTDWLPDDPINEDDVNRWEKGIKDAHTDLAAHKNDMNNPHKTTKAQIGLGNVDNVQQAAKKDFDQHNQDQNRHVTIADKDKWDAGQLFKLTEDNGLAKYRSGADFNTVTDTGLYYMSSVTTALNAPVNNNGYLFVHNYGTYAYQEYTSYSSSDSTSSGRRKFMRNKVSGSDSWTSWRELESVEGSQAKVDVHANKKDIHVTKNDKDKWDGAQLSKITNDVGGVAFAVNEGEDMLQAIINRGRGMGTFYANGKAVNSPSAASTRGFYQMTSQTEDGKGQYGWVYAMDYRNNVFTNYWDGNTVGWQGWKKLETETASQEKADKALSDAKAFVQANFTNQALIILTGTDAIQDARISGESYPIGLTFIDIGQGNTTGYPLQFGFVKNEKYSNYRFTQYFYGTNNDSRNYANSPEVWIRKWQDTGWTKWEKISGFAHANVSVSGVQYLKQIDHTKIAFNRKIKDSHDAFDTKNNRFVAPNDGMYLVTVGLYMINYAFYTNFHLKLYRNGKEYKTLDHYRGYFDNGKEMNVGLNGTATVPMNKGDYVEIFCYCNYGGDETIKRGITDKNGVYNFFDIQEIGGLNYPDV